VGTGKTDLRVSVGSKLLYFFSPRKYSADRLTALSTRLANYSLFVELNSFSFGSMQSFEKEIYVYLNSSTTGESFEPKRSI
jgi:hypothetical protein